ncbi:hypothetical protein Q3G72_034988 [Acer saccharum]|nr:hypothetical protein Q3G72_034988 [Acer saccharum]
MLQTEGRARPDPTRPDPYLYLYPTTKTMTVKTNNCPDPVKRNKWNPKALIKVGVRLKNIATIEDILRLEGKHNEFMTSCFKHFSGFPTNWLFSAQIVHNLLLREITVDGATENELFVSIGGKKARFGQREFCMVTGLRFGELSDIAQVLEVLEATDDEAQKDYMVGVDFNMSEGPQFISPVEMETKEDNESLDDLDDGNDGDDGDDGGHSAAGSGPEDEDAEFDFEGAQLGSDDEDDDYEDASGGSKLDQVLSTVKEIKERTEMLHKRMDLFEAELRHHRDDTADIRKELRLRPYHRRRPASSA